MVYKTVLESHSLPVSNSRLKTLLFNTAFTHWLDCCQRLWSSDLMAHIHIRLLLLLLLLCRQ